MRSILIILELIGIGGGLYHYFTLPPEVAILEPSERGGLVTMKTKNVKGEYSTVGEFDMELRVFGTNRDFSRAGPFLLVSDLIIAVDRHEAEAVFHRTGGEENIIGKAGMMNLIIQDEDSSNELHSIFGHTDERNCASMSGTTYHLEHFYADDKELTDFTLTSEMNSDPYKVYKINRLRIVPCY